jgi:hypothetical protein
MDTNTMSAMDAFFAKEKQASFSADRDAPERYKGDEQKRRKRLQNRVAQRNYRQSFYNQAANPN